jgi:hypothetical protein
MKKFIYFLLALIAVIAIACNNQKKAVIDNPYAGAWELTYTKSVTSDSTVETTHFANPSIKLLTQKHYAFGRQEEENKIYGGGGRYAYLDSVFTTYPEYHSGSNVVGGSLRWKSKITGDLWTIFIDTLNTKRTETWIRIIE